MWFKAILSATILILLAFFVVLQTGALNHLAAMTIGGVPFGMLAVTLGFVFFVSACWVASTSRDGGDAGR